MPSWGKRMSRRLKHPVSIYARNANYSPPCLAEGYTCTGCGYQRWGKALRWHTHTLCVGCVAAVLEDVPIRRINALYGIADTERKELVSMLEQQEAEQAKAVPQRGQAALWDYVDGQYVPDVPLGWLREWEKNPRKRFEQTALYELADSIQADGVQQPIVVRLKGKKDNRPDLEIVMGERRWRASVLAGRPHIPAIVRVGMDDKTALRLAVAENIKRRDLNGMEEADSYRALLDEGYSQDEVAAQVGLDKSTISNALRLRKLPDTIQGMVRDGSLSSSHARALLRFEGFSAVQEAIAKLAIEDALSAKAIEKGIPFVQKLSDKQLVIPVYTSVRFNKSAHCEQCKYNAYRLHNDLGYCLNPAHFHELTAEADAERERKMEQARQDVARREAEQRAALQAMAAQSASQVKVDAFLEDAPVLEPKEEPGSQAVAQPEVTELLNTVAAIEQAAMPEHIAAPMLSRRDLRYGEYEEIWNTAPNECKSDGSTCPCKIPVDKNDFVCLNPSRFRGLQQAAGKAKTAERKAMFAEYAERLFALALYPLDGQPSPNAYERALAMLLWTHFDKLNKAVVAKILPEIAGTPLADLLQTPRYGRNDRACYDALAALSPHKMVTLAARAVLLQEMQSALENKSDSLPDTKWFFGDLTAKEDAEPNAASDQVDAEPGMCLNCDSEIAMDLLGSGVEEETDEWKRLESGVTVFADGDMMCPTCSLRDAEGLSEYANTDEHGNDVEEPKAEVPEETTPVRYMPGQRVEVNTGSLTNGNPHWRPAVVQEADLFIKTNRLRLRMGEPGTNLPIVYRDAEYVRPAQENSPVQEDLVLVNQDAFEDPACSECGERRAQVGGKCRQCLDAESKQAEQAAAL